MFVEKEIIQLRRLCQDVIYNLIPIDHQEAVVRDGCIWCSDWWTIEVLKCLFLGEEVYRRDPPPRRLRNNTIFSLENITQDTVCKRNMFKALKENASYSDRILICEIGRGIDLLLASIIKPQAQFMAYDSNPHVIEKVKQYFIDRLGLNLKLECMPSNKYELTKERPLIVLANNTKGIEAAEWYVKKEFDSMLFIYNGVIQAEENHVK